MFPLNNNEILVHRFQYYNNLHISFLFIFIKIISCFSFVEPLIPSVLDLDIKVLNPHLANLTYVTALPAGGATVRNDYYDSSLAKFVYQVIPLSANGTAQTSVYNSTNGRIFVNKCIVSMTY